MNSYCDLRKIKGFEEFNLFKSEGKFNIPTIDPCNIVPDKIIGFNYARTSKDFDSCVHFFLDDYQFERCWNRPDENIELLSKFKSCMTPDFSLYTDMPLAMMIWNVYRSRLFGQMCQKKGLQVIPTVQYAGPESYDFCFDGMPRHSTVAISSVGVCNDRYAINLFNRGFFEMCERLEPSTVIFYGKNIIHKCSAPIDINVIEFANYAQKMRERI